MKADRSPAVLWYPNDILSSGRVNALSPLEELWYRRSLDYAWMSGGMPADPAEFAGWIGRGCTAEAAEKIIEKFYRPDRKNPDRVVNDRQEKERRKLREKTAKLKEAGRKSGESRRKQRDLAREQGSNDVRAKSNISSSISIPNQISSSKDSAEQNRSDLDRWLTPCLKAFPETDARAVEIGILYTLIQRQNTEPIRSAKYFTPEIEKASAAGLTSETLDALLARRRQQFFSM